MMVGMNVDVVVMEGDDDEGVVGGSGAKKKVGVVDGQSILLVVNLNESLLQQ